MIKSNGQFNEVHKMTKTKLNNSSWNTETTYALGLYRSIFQSLGIWPFQCQNVIYMCLTLFHYFLQITMIIEILGEVVYYKSGIDPQIISNLSCNFLTLIKITLIRFKRIKIQQVLESIIDLWKSKINSDYLMLIKYKAKLGRNICIYQLGSTYFVLIPMIIGALPIFVPSDNSTFNESGPVLRSFPIQTPYMFANIPNWCYILVFILQIFQLFSTVTGNVGVDCCFFGIVMNFCGQIQCLSCDFKKFDLIKDEVIILNNFSLIVQEHNRFIQLAEYLEETFNLIIFCIVGSNVAQVCFYGIQLLRSLRHGNSVIAINSSLCIFILSFQIFLYSWAGDQLSSAFENFKFSSFNCGWNEMPLKFKKNLIFIMMRTHRQFNLTAGKVYRMDLDNFKNIMKAIGSYFSVMQTMFED